MGDASRPRLGGEDQGRYGGGLTPEEERSAIEAALAEAGGVRSGAAGLLGMSRTTLWRKLKALGWLDA